MGPGRDMDDPLARLAVLVVDDEPGIRSLIARSLGPHVARLAEAESAAEAGRRLERAHFDLIVLDNVMPGLSGLDWLDAQRRLGLAAGVIVISGYADLDAAIRALRAGAADLLRKPFRGADLIAAIRRWAAGGVGGGLPSPAPRPPAARLIGGAPAIEEVRALVARVAGGDMPVLLTGETGTGKATAARLLHALSRLADRPLVAVPCAGREAVALERELFGTAEAPGLLARHRGATLLLDDATELPLATQARLLPMLGQGGGMRVLATSQAEPEAELAAGRLRPDFLHRLDRVRLRLPPLRERVGDLPALVDHLTAEERVGDALAPVAHEGAIARMAAHPWPGNLHELRNVVARAALTGRWPAPFDAPPGPEPGESLAAVERRHVLSVLAACGGKRAEAARRLGVSRKTIDRKCAQWEGGDPR
jgi:DNA-binding NtrC family response regulator